MFRRIGLGALSLFVAGQLAAQEKPEERPTGLPKKVQWTFNLDAGLGFFGFSNSLYRDVKPDPSGDLSDNWIESYIKPAISGVMTTGKSEFFGKLSFAGERTFAAPPPVVGEEASSFQIDEGYLGWRSGTAIGSSENTLEFTFGRAQYKIGHGMLLWDGGGEGGTRGGYWSNARKAWALAGVATFQPKHHKFDLFYVDRDETPESETGTKAYGVNYDLTLGEEGTTTLGGSYIKFEADPTLLASRDGLSVYNLRAFTAPLKSLPGLAFELEWAQEDNGELRNSTAWNAQGSYTFGGGWKPRISYRYAYFQGDDPDTDEDESFDSLIPGFYDWGTWWQGEIGGEYFLGNSNLISHQVRLHLTSSDRLGWGVIGYSFEADQPATFAPGVTSKSIAVELDFYADWKLNSNFTVSFLGAYADPKEAAEQGFGRTSNFTYGMLYIAYAF